MSIKTEVIHTQANKDVYPFIGINKINGIVVIFTESRTGILIDKGDSTYYISYRSVCWDMEDFEKLDGSITLSNG